MSFRSFLSFDKILSNSCDIVPESLCNFRFIDFSVDFYIRYKIFELLCLKTICVDIRLVELCVRHFFFSLQNFQVTG